jgi:dienelactone hydrolase
MRHFLAIMLLALAPGPRDEPPARRVRIDEAQAARDLESLGARWSDMESWAARRAAIREHVLRTMGLDPLPLAAPAAPIPGPARVHDGYAVRNIAFEALPGFYVTGNLYAPHGRPRSGAAVLCPHGHFRASPEDPEGRFRRDMQLRCATLARMGAVVLAIDMVGWGESTQAPHDDADALTLQTLSSIRAVDLLERLDGVDPDRIGVTGASGGGTQSFLLACLDERIAASVPVVMVSAHFFGGCLCESGKPIQALPDLPTNNAEIAAVAAPRPQLLISCGEDWTKHNPDVEAPFVRSIYGLYGAADRFAHVHLADEAHDYGPSKRAAAYRFLARHLGLDLAAVTRLDGSIDETPVTIEPRDTMLAFTVAAPRPSRGLQGYEQIIGALRAAQAGAATGQGSPRSP